MSQAIQTLKQYYLNPRKISERQFSILGDKLEEFGDLSGIVFNRANGQLVGGNQRTRFFQQFGEEAQIEVTQEYDEPDEQGTIALGYILFRGGRYAYREVVYDEETMKRANIAANRVGGEFDFEALTSMLDVDDLLANGFEPIDLGMQQTDIPVYGQSTTEWQASGTKQTGGEPRVHEGYQPPADSIRNPNPIVTVELAVPKNVRDYLYSVLEEVRQEYQMGTRDEAMAQFIKNYQQMTEQLNEWTASQESGSDAGADNTDHR